MSEPEAAVAVTAETKVLATEPKEPASEELLEAVKERLRFFFSDSNLRYDQFLRKLLLDSNKVTVETLLRFNTIKKLSEDPSVIVQAAKALPDQLLVSDDNAVSLVTSFSLERMEDHIPISLLLNNIPLREETPEQAEDEKRKPRRYYDVSREDILALFEGAEVSMVKLRFRRMRGPSSDDDDDLFPSKNVISKKRRVPMGSAIVEFKNKEELNKVADDVLTSKGGESVEAKRKLELKGSVLEVLLLEDYAGVVKKRKLEDDKDTNGEESPIPAPKFEFEWKPGCVVQLRGLAKDCDREAILESVAAALGITEEEVKARKVYADFSRGQVDGAVRFLEPSDDVKILCEKLASGDVMVKGSKVEAVEVLDGEEETKYWNNYIEFKTRQMQQRAEQRSPRKKRRFSRD